MTRGEGDRRTPQATAAQGSPGTASPPGAPVIARLRKFSALAREELCHLCGASLPVRHPHLLDRHDGRVLCACNPCALLFEGSGAGRHRRIHHRVERDASLRARDALDRLSIPVGLAAVRRSSRAVEALYPSPAGIIESRLDGAQLDAWLAASSVDPAAWPDDTALLLDALGTRDRCHWVSLDVCFALMGRLRTLRTMDPRVITEEVDRALAGERP